MVAEPCDGWLIVCGGLYGETRQDYPLTSITKRQ